MLAIIGDVAVVEAGMEAVSEVGAAGDGKGVRCGSAGVGEIAGEVIAGVEGDALAAVARDFDGGAGIVALGGILDALDDAPTGIGAVVGNQGAVTESAGAGSRCTGVGVGVAKGIGRHLIEVHHSLKVLAVAAGVGEPHASIVAQILFESQVPLLYGRILVVDGKGVIEASGPGGTARGGVEGICKAQERGGGAGLEILIIGADVTCMDGPAGDERKAQRRLNEAAPSAAHHSMVVAVGTPSEAEARTPIGSVGVTQRLGKSGLRRG